MKLIVAVDDNMGMLFNKRRQSRDILLRKRILEIIENKELFINAYTAKQFSEEMTGNIIITENPMGILDSDGYCFVEDLDVLQYESNFDKIIIYSWNRVYPKDLTFNIDLNNWECVSEFDFVGNSHDNITERIYIRKEKKMKNKKFLVFLTSLLLLCSFTLTGCGEVANLGSDLSELGSIIGEVESAISELESVIDSNTSQNSESTTPEISGPVSLDSIPAYSSEPYVVINNNEPFFEDFEINTTVFENYAELDSLGRCGVAYANICKELMPTDDRESISNVKPSGWINKPYDFVDGRYLYNRCHLIGFQLAGENANKLNLITGTRYMNVQGMLPFENMIDDYVDETNNHVLYRVTPIYTGDNLVADGVLMEAYSVEDDGDGICFNIFCYNVQPGVKIDYATGDNWLDGENAENTDSEKSKAENYVLNTKSKKFHKESCSGISKITEENKEEVKTTKEDLINKGYDPCGTCKP